jgi:uncharacterized protein (TIGR02266 family)
MSSTQPRFPAALRVAFSGVEGFSESTNISSGGMFVRTGERFNVGAILSLSVELPDGAPPAPVRAKVVHAKPPVRVLTPGVGLQFIQADDGFHVRLEQYIRTIARASQVPVELLLVARDLLHESGWTQFNHRAPDGSYCLTGALWRAAGQDRDAYKSALESVGPRLNVPPCPHGGFRCHCALLSWNDQDGRTKRDVIAKLDEVIHAALGTAA